MNVDGTSRKPIDVLLVEDSVGDVRLTQETFRTLNRTIRMHVAFDGVEAMAFLQRKGMHADAYRPDLILLDLNLPKMDGKEVLARVKGDASLKRIPIIILTTSDSEADVATCYHLGASCYLKKPVELEEFEVLVKCIHDFWFVKKKRHSNGTDQSSISVRH